MAAFKEVPATGGTLNIQVYNTLLFLTCGGDQWENYARGKPIVYEVKTVSASGSKAASHYDMPTAEMSPERGKQV